MTGFGEQSAGLSMGANHQQERTAPADVHAELVYLRQRVRELDAAQQAADTANQVQAQVMASLHHEIRTSLNAVVGMATSLCDTVLDDTQRELTQAIQQRSNAMLTMIADVLDLTRVEAGYLELEYVPFSMHALLEATCAVFSQQARQKHLHLEWTIDDSVPATLVGDEHRIRQVLVNLISNALKFTDTGSVCVHVTAARQDAPLLIAESPDYLPAYELHIHVTDTGRGIPAADLPYIFDPFTPVRARNTDGAGLGLSITRRLVEAMDGRIAVESEPGVGSSFRVVLRAYGSPVELPAPNSPPVPHLEPPCEPLHILIVEDNTLNAQVLLHTLRRLNMSADLAHSGQEALDRLTTRSYNLILMDIQMPDMDGVAVTRQIRASMPSASRPQIIAVTAYAIAGVRQWLTETGFDDYIEKPIRVSLLVQALHAAALRLAKGHDAAEPVSQAHLLTADLDAIPIYSVDALQELMDVLGDGAMTATMIAAMYLEDIDQHLQRLVQHAAQHEVATCVRIAHSMVSLAAQIGAMRLAHVLGKIETHVATQPALLDPLVAAVQAAYQQLQATLRENGVFV